MKKKNKINSIILLSLVSLPYLLLFVFFIQQKIIQFEKSRELQHGPTITMVIDASDVLWFKKNKELIIDGKLFDVKTSQEQNGKLIVQGFFDGDETELIEKIHQISKNKNHLSSLTFLTLLLGGCLPAIMDAEKAFIQHLQLARCERKLFLPEVYTSIAVPPPQVLCSLT